MFFVSKGNRFDVYLTTLQLVLVPVLYVHEQEGHSDATLGAKKKENAHLSSVTKTNAAFQRKIWIWKDILIQEYKAAQNSLKSSQHTLKHINELRI